MSSILSYSLLLKTFLNVNNKYLHSGPFIYLHLHLVAIINSLIKIIVLYPHKALNSGLWYEKRGQSLKISQSECALSCISQSESAMDEV